MTNLRLYCGTYHKYNSGSLYGKWLDLNEFESIEELYQTMRELHRDEDDPEFMFQDYECSNLIENMGLISESHLSQNIYEVLEAINESEYDFEVIEAYCDCVGCYDSEIDNIIDKIENSYFGEHLSDVDFVRNLLEECGDIPESLPSYIHIDWKSTAWDVMLDYSTSNNHYFRNL